jgi:hypothetical protein
MLRLCEADAGAAIRGRTVGPCRVVVGRECSWRSYQARGMPPCSEPVTVRRGTRPEGDARPEYFTAGNNPDHLQREPFYGFATMRFARKALPFDWR